MAYLHRPRGLKLKGGADLLPNPFSNMVISRCYWMFFWVFLCVPPLFSDTVCREWHNIIFATYLCTFILLIMFYKIPGKAHRLQAARYTSLSSF